MPPGRHRTSGVVRAVKWPLVAESLLAGETVTLRPHGNSMTPLIESGQRIVISPCWPRDVRLDDIVLAKVKGVYYVHKVTGIQGHGVRRFQISNNHGHVNGWTTRVYGKVTEIGG